MNRLIALFAALLLCSGIQTTAKVPARTSRHLIVAASDSPARDKRMADFVCTGTNDERIINKAIESLEYGGTVQLLDGNYYIDAFEQEGNSAILFGFNGGRARTITIKGTTENKSYNSQYGACIRVTQKAMDAMDPEQTYRVFYGTPRKPVDPVTGKNNWKDNYFAYTYINCANFENFLLFFANAGKKLVGLDCSKLGNCEINLVGIYTERHFEERYLHLPASMPAEGCIGIISPRRSNDDTSRLAFNTVCIGGLYVGIKTNAIDHLIMYNCSVARCTIGYWFDGPGAKTLTMLNCADEGNTHLPRFTGTGHLTCIDFNIERFNADYIPLDPTGNPEHRALEEVPGGWHGFISYTMQGKAFGLGDGEFWAEGCGSNFKTVNLDRNASEWPL